MVKRAAIGASSLLLEAFFLCATVISMRLKAWVYATSELQLISVTSLSQPFFVTNGLKYLAKRILVFLFTDKNTCRVDS